MEKKTTITDVGNEIYFYPLWGDNNRELRSIDEIIDRLKQAKENGATHIDWNYDSYDGDGCNIQPICQKLETDDEFDLRVKQEQDWIEEAKKQQDAKRRRMYEELKKEFEGK